MEPTVSDIERAKETRKKQKRGLELQVPDTPRWTHPTQMPTHTHTHTPYPLLPPNTRRVTLETHPFINII